MATIKPTAIADTVLVMKPISAEDFSISFNVLSNDISPSGPLGIWQVTTPTTNKGAFNVSTQLGVLGEAQPLGVVAYNLAQNQTANYTDTLTYTPYVSAPDGSFLINNSAVVSVQVLMSAISALKGTAASETIFGNSANNVIEGAGGADTIDGRGGVDTASYASSVAAVTVNLLTNVNTGGDAQGDKLFNIENVVGSAFNDSLTGNAANNVLDGAAGADTMAGGLGNDTYYVDNVNDVVVEAIGQGVDTVVSSVSFAGNTAALMDTLENITLVGTAYSANGTNLSNVINGTASDNALLGLGGNDTINGGAGNDIIYGDNGFLGFGPTGNDTLNGGDGNDQLFGEDGNDVLNGGAGIDTMIGGLGNDTYYVDSVSDSVIENVGEGVDTVVSSVSFAGNTAALMNTIENITLVGTAYSANGTNLSNVINGTASDNALLGLGGNDTINGGAGNDIIYGDNGFLGFGPTGNDTLNGGAGNDQLFGEDGDDTLFGDVGADVLDGGSGVDTASFYYTNQPLNTLMIDLSTGQAKDVDGKIDSLRNIENIIGSKGNDMIAGSMADNVLDGREGNDILSGSWGNDVLRGGDGSDDLIGGAGLDTLTGGAGNDVFHFDRNVGVDRITDFVVGQDKFSFDNEWSGFSLADKMATVQFVQSGTSAVLQVDSNLTAAGVTWVNVATFENQNASVLNIAEAILFG